MLSNRIITWIVSKFERNAKFQTLVKSTCAEYYIKESLKQNRIWGDATRVKVGKDVQMNNALINTVSGDVSIGDHSFFGHNVSLLTGTHDITKRGVERHTAYPVFGRDITIGKGVWIASNVIVVGPCTIGDNAVIAAGSVITGNLESDSVYSGTLAKLVRHL